MRAVIVFCVTLLSVAAVHAAHDHGGHDHGGHDHGSHDHSKDHGKDEWWQSMSLYQIYPRSYKDSDGDGVGDLKGIMIKLDHLVKSNVNAFWMSPIYPSPMVDFGYDISDFLAIDSVFGTMEDFTDLVNLAHDVGMKVIMDFVPNHSSDQHNWFKLSLINAEPYTDFYVWHKGHVLQNGTRVPPNNWVSAFGGPAWTWREERQAYYLHQFAPEQPDLNYKNKNVVREMQNVLKYWLSKGVDGFRIDAIPHLCEDDLFRDEPLTGNTNDPNNYGYTYKIYTKDQPLTYDVVRGWKGVLNEYNGTRIMMMEAYANMTMTMKYYEAGATFPFNFGMITDLNKDSTAADFKKVIDQWMKHMPNGQAANWVAGNHDQPRLVTRFGYQRALAVTMMTLLLPGVSVTYNGDEIGMSNTWVSWDDTMDPQGCNAGMNGFETASRDPARTPFQWDSTPAAGFSTNRKTWLPINPNYRTVNLAVEDKQKDSYFNFYKAVSKLKKWHSVRKGSLVTKLLNDNVLAFSRHASKHSSVYAVTNFGNKEETVDLSMFDNISEHVKVYYATTSSDLAPESVLTDIKNAKIPPLGVMIYISESKD